MMYYPVDSGYERAPVIDREVVTRWPRFPTVSLLVVMNDRPAIRCATNLDPLVADLIFYHSRGNCLRFGIHYDASLLGSLPHIRGSRHRRPPPAQEVTCG
jgi:hypothetical protein